MVFQKKTNKGGKPFQKNQQKKPVQKELNMFDDVDDDDSDSDSEDDSDEVQKTPANKTPKGKQSLNEKRVSFQVPGNKTPGKTPNKENPMGKKQTTPGKTNLKEFKGMKQMTKKNSQQDGDDDDDDDEDEDDSDFEADLDMDLGDDDDDDLDDDDDEEDDDDEQDNNEEEDDDDDDDDDEDDDDDDEEDEDEPQNKNQKGLKNQKQNNVQAKQKTPLKGVEKQNSATPKAAQTPKGAVSIKSEQTPKTAATPKNIKKEKASPQVSGSAAPLDEAERRRLRDLKQLYVGNLPGDITAEELKELSSDILSCILPRKDHKLTNVYAFLLFESEEKAEENYNILKEKKLRGQPLTIDYVGDKSLNRQTKEDKKVLYNMKKLYVSGLPIDCTIYQVAKFFPKAHTIMFNQSPAFRSANVLFWTEDEATEAFNATKEIEISGQKVSVLHSIMPKKQLKKNNKRKRKPSPSKMMNNQNQKNNKKMKFTPKKEINA